MGIYRYMYTHVGFRVSALGCWGFLFGFLGGPPGFRANRSFRGHNPTIIPIGLAGLVHPRANNMKKRFMSAIFKQASMRKLFGSAQRIDLHASESPFQV